jgi:hypothetical protein
MPKINKTRNRNPKSEKQKKTKRTKNLKVSKMVSESVRFRSLGDGGTRILRMFPLSRLRARAGEANSEVLGRNEGEGFRF